MKITDVKTGESAAGGRVVTAVRTSRPRRFFYRVRRAGDRWTVSAWRDTPAVAVPVAHRVSYREVLAVLARARRRSAQAG